MIIYLCIKFQSNTLIAFNLGISGATVREVASPLSLMNKAKQSVFAFFKLLYFLEISDYLRVVTNFYYYYYYYYYYYDYYYYYY